MRRAPRTPTNRRVSALLCAGALALGCSGTNTSDPLIPATGVLVKAESVLGAQGCGRGATEVFKYVAVAVDSRGGGIAGSVYDCFADGQFDLLPPNELAAQVDLVVFAFNAEAYEAQRATIDPLAADALGLRRDTRPTWTTKCRATQQADIQVLARCDKLTPGLGGIDAGQASAQAVIELATQRFSSPKAGAAPLECGKEFTTVRVRYSAAGASAEAGPITCPAPVSLTVPAPATYALEVALFDAQGVAIALRSCRASASPGLSATATCD